jgi:hypothetical protein
MGAARRKDRSHGRPLSPAGTLAPAMPSPTTLDDGRPLHSGLRNMNDVIDIVGIDWSGARDAGRRAWVCRATGVDGEVHVSHLHRVADSAGRTVEDLRAYVESEIIGPPGSRWIGIDFPFSVTRGVIEHLDYGTWSALVSAWEARFPDALSFAKECTKASLKISDKKEARRRTDFDARAPMSPWNLRLFRQTYHGMRLLRRLVAMQRVAILPWDRPDQGEVRVVEICPAATLATAGEESRGYKGRRGAHAGRRRDLLGVARRSWGLSINRGLANVVISDCGGDALDAVLAAASTYHHAALLSPAQHAIVRTEADLLEGRIYAARSSR